MYSSSESTKEKQAKVDSKSDLTDKIVNMVIKQDGKIEPACDLKSHKPSDDKQIKSYLGLDVKGPGVKKEVEELPPNFPHAPIIARPRGFMGRFKPQLHRSLLENFGFECVMHYCEEHGGRKKERRDEVIDRLER